MSTSSMNPASQGAGMADTTQQDSTQGGAGQDSGGAPDMSNGYVIKVMVDPSNSISVSVDPMSDDDAQEMQDDGQSQQVPTPRAACQIIMDIIKNAGQMGTSDAEQNAMSSAYGPQQGGGAGAASGMTGGGMGQ